MTPAASSNPSRRDCATAADADRATCAVRLRTRQRWGGCNIYRDPTYVVDEGSRRHAVDPNRGWSGRSDRRQPAGSSPALLVSGVCISSRASSGMGGIPCPNPPVVENCRPTAEKSVFRHDADVRGGRRRASVVRKARTARASRAGPGYSAQIGRPHTSKRDGHPDRHRVFAATVSCDYSLHLRRAGPNA